MKINKVILKNIFSYKDTVSFDFNASKNMHLIIGENGFGKTSFINSLKIALHGITKELLQIGETKLTKFEFVQGSQEKHFSGLVNRVALESDIRECCVSVEFSHEKKNYRLSRLFKTTNTAYTEELELIILNDGSKILEDDEAQDFINSIISPSLAKFFFFDGEKVQDIANFSNDEFRLMLEDVLELNVYDQIIGDYGKLKNEYLKNGIKDKDIKEKFENTTKLMEQKKLDIEKHLQNIKNAKLVIRDVKKELTVVKNKIKKLNSQYTQEISFENNLLSEAKVDKEKKLELFKKVSMSCLPLLLNKELGLKTEFDILNNYYDSNYIPIEVLKRKKIEFMEVINEKLKNGEDIEEIFDSVFFAENKGIRVSFVDTSKAEFQYKSLDLNILAFSALLEDLIELDNKIDHSESVIKEINIAIKENENSLAILIEEQSNKSTFLTKKEAEIEINNDLIIEATNSIDAFDKELHSLSITEHKDNLLLASIETCEKIILTATRMKTEIKIQKRASLEAKINEKFKLLVKDDYEAHSLKIDDKFTINIFSEDNKAMDILSSSSGQKQIIATSLIWAISEYVDSDMPMIVDTPLGRLDDKNQKLLLDNFYPNASTQIIMLPTPSELRADGFDALKDNASIYKLSSNGSIAQINRNK